MKIAVPITYEQRLTVAEVAQTVGAALVDRHSLARTKHRELPVAFIGRTFDAVPEAFCVRSVSVGFRYSPTYGEVDHVHVIGELARVHPLRFQRLLHEVHRWVE